MNTETLIAAAVRMYGAADPLITYCQGLIANMDAKLVTSNQYYNATLAAAQRAEAAAASGGGGGTAPAGSVIALLHFTEVGNNVRPTTWVNSVAGGVVFNNWGNTTTVGGSGSTLTPFGAGYNGEAANGATAAITSASQVTITGDFTVEGFINTLDIDRELFQFSTNGTDDGAMRIRLTLQKNTGENHRIVAFAKVGGVDIQAFETAPLVAATVGGLADSYHYAFQRENGILTMRVNGSKIATATVATPGTLTGYLDIFGSYNRVADAANGLFRAKVAELRVTTAAVYTGATYTVPNARFF